MIYRNTKHLGDYAIKGKMIGAKSPNFKGGWINICGYKCLMVNSKQVLEHRYIMEQYLGIKLKRTHHVHHINGIKTDNRINNLVLCPTPKSHFTIDSRIGLGYPKGRKMSKATRLKMSISGKKAWRNRKEINGNIFI